MQVELYLYNRLFLPSPSSKNSLNPFASEGPEIWGGGGGIGTPDLHEIQNHRIQLIIYTAKPKIINFSSCAKCECKFRHNPLLLNDKRQGRTQRGLSRKRFPKSRLCNREGKALAHVDSNLQSEIDGIQCQAFPA